MTILISLAGVNTGNNLIYLLSSFLLAYMLLSGWFAQANLSGIEVELEMPPEIYAGVATPIAVKLTNKKRFLPSFFVYVKVAGASNLLDFLPSKSASSCRIILLFPKRGKNHIDKIILGSVFPFNFFERYKVISKKYDLIVYPKPIKSEIFNPSNPAGSSKNVVKSCTGILSYENLVSIRNYIPGDPWKLINWKATAKTLSLKVNELEPEKSGEIILDLREIDVDDAESQLSRYAYAVLIYLGRGVSVGIKSDAFFIKPATGLLQKRRLLEALALYGQN